MNTPIFRHPLLMAAFVAGAALCGCTRAAKQPATPEPVTARAMQAPTPLEIKLGEPPRMPEKK
jgi:hypothetical protein